MVEDILIGALLVVSGCINLLAIGAFWVTPSLRTTANRFVINLLLVNFISCLVLSPFAFNVNVNSSTIAAAYVDSNVSLNLTSEECFNQTHECLEQPTKLSPEVSISINSSDEKNEGKSLENVLMKYNIWSLDLVVALSVFAVLLVVMDTFIAITDPLRYHSRISDLKAWFLIAFSWIFGASFGLASALRMRDGKQILSNNDTYVYNMMFLLTYFLSIIVMPFLLVILMYWKIYSEAKSSGKRMRQNGSSPLLQSALNLAAAATAHQQQSTILTSPQNLLLVTSFPHPSKLSTLSKQETADSYFHHSKHASDGLTMKIDKQDYYSINNNNMSQQINLNTNNNLSYVNSSAFSDTTTFLLTSPPEIMPMLRTSDETTSKASKIQQNQNILLTLTTACDHTIKRNHSAKHLLIETSVNDVARQSEIRKVCSTPNLQKFTDTMGNNHEQTLELPSTQASPKTLRYMTSLRHRLSNASSLFKYREEGRAARISILVVIMFLLTYFPYGLLSLIHDQDSIMRESCNTILSILFVLLANVCSPIIFAYRNKKIRRGIRRFLRIDKKTNERLEKLNSLKRSCSMRIKNYRQNNFHKSLNLNFKDIKENNIRRSQSFVTCKYLTPPDATKIALSDTQNIHHASSPNTTKDKKSLLNIVYDNSRNFGRHCQNGHPCSFAETLPVEV